MKQEKNARSRDIYIYKSFWASALVVLLDDDGISFDVVDLSSCSSSSSS